MSDKFSGIAADQAARDNVLGVDLDASALRVSEAVIGGPMG